MPAAEAERPGQIRGPSCGARARPGRQRHHQHDRPPLDLRAPPGSGGVGDGAGRAVQPLRHRPDRPHQVVLLDPEVGADRRGGRVGGQHDQRRPALGGLGQAGHGVGQARPLVDGADADPAADPSVGVGHRDRAALVARGQERGAVLDQGVGDHEVAAAEHPEDVVCAEPRPAPADRLRDVHHRSGAPRRTPAPNRLRVPPTGSGPRSPGQC